MNAHLAFTDSRFSTSTAFLGQTSTSFVFNGLISRSKKYEVNSESVVANSQKPEEDEISYRGFSNFDEIALTHPNDQQKDLAGKYVCTNTQLLIYNYLAKYTIEF